MNLNSEKTERLVELCKINEVELSDNPTRVEMLKKLGELKELVELKTVADNEAPAESEKPAKQNKKGKQNKGFAMYKEYKLTPVSRGSMKLAQGRKDLVSVPYAYDAEGYPVQFVHAEKGKVVKETSLTAEQVSVLNSHAHSTMRWFEEA